MIKILIIDDDDGVRESLYYHFEDCGYNVYVASTAEDAESKVLEIEYDAVIVDLRLPNMRGDEFIKNVYNKTKSTKFIIYTGSEEYTLNDDLKNLSRVCKNVYYKPVVDLFLFNKEIESNT